jgi:hypothetical protein
MTQSAEIGRRAVGSGRCTTCSSVTRRRWKALTCVDTPTLIIDGVVYRGAYDATSLLEALAR